jgi:hypothetical protein
MPPAEIVLFASPDTAGLQATFDAAWKSALPHTVLLDPGGKILYKNLGRHFHSQMPAPWEAR